MRIIYYILTIKHFIFKSELFQFTLTIKYYKSYFKLKKNGIYLHTAQPRFLFSTINKLYCTSRMYAF